MGSRTSSEGVMVGKAGNESVEHGRTVSRLVSFPSLLQLMSTKGNRDGKLKSTGREERIGKGGKRSWQRRIGKEGRNGRHE